LSAILVACLAVALRQLIDTLLNPQIHAFLLYYPAVILSALYLGLGPALVSLAVCVASIAVFIVPVSRWFHLEEPLDITDIGVFVALAAMLSMLVDSQRRSRERATQTKRQLEDYARRLENEAAERARAERSLRQSHEDLEDLVHIVSHDLKEPLRGITATATFLRDDYADKLPQDGKDRLATLIRLPVKLAGMIDALLEYSQAWRGELNLADTDLSKVVGDVVDSLRPWLAHQHAEVVINPLPTLRCDRVRVAQVFSNLITNGAKYSRAEHKRVEVGAAHDGALYVRDNGIGIPPNQTQQIWRMFKRLHRTEDFGGGTGSGLALVKKTIERHGGRIWVESTPGQGSTFYFTLSPQAAAEREPKIEQRVSA
jgi:light-regulated signal transduction histidine kinase (bacteriophytochrome)